MAVLTAQSRISIRHPQVLGEVALGALLGVALTLVIFKLWFPSWRGGALRAGGRGTIGRAADAR